nr:MAG TPA: hypothetical protein [Bacteriophage sp.]
MDIYARKTDRLRGSVRKSRFYFILLATTLLLLAVYIEVLMR